jgi:hypothetical protein
MSEPERPLLADLTDRIGEVAGDLRQMLSLRLELALLEFKASSRCLQRMAAAALVAGIMAFTSLPLLVLCVAESLNGCFGIGRIGWLWIFSLGLAIGSLAIGLLAWRHFRRSFAGMAETLEECREDIVWLREWLGKADK